MARDGNTIEHFRRKLVGSLEELGPGLITGAADDDPSGIATYSQAGAQFGYGLMWTMLLCYSPAISPAPSRSGSWAC